MQKNKKEVIVHTSDPRGKTVELTKKRFEEHIQGRAGHLSVDGIKETIEQPNFILQDSEHAERQNYYKVPNKQNEKAYYKKVVVHFQSELEPGNVVTAFITSTVKTGSSEDVLWQKK